MNIGSLIVGRDQPVAFIAELSNSHNQSLDRALRMLDSAKASGASAAKIQVYSPDDLVSLRGDGPAPAPWNGMTMRELYTRAATPFAWVPALFAHAASISLPLFSSVFGPDGFRVLEDCGNPVYKLAALDYGKEGLLAMVRATGKPVIRSCAATSAPWTDDCWLFAPPGYPQERFGFRQTNISQYGDVEFGTFDGYDGFSYHGTDPLPCVVAAALGAKLIEFHFMLEAEPSELEANVSLTERQAAEMIRTLRRVEGMLAA